MKADALTAVRFVDRRETDTQGPEGPRVRVTEHWTDGTVTTRYMGPAETAAHLRHQENADD